MSEFEALGIQQWLSKQCAYMGLHQPTPIQKLCIPAILADKCVVGGAATGSGKTAAFALPVLQKLAEDPYGVFALVLTPSRELAYQILDQFVAFGAPFHVRAALLIGGVPHEQQLSVLQGRPHIVVATPGRLKFLLAHFTEASKAFSHLRFLILDEADRLTSDDIEDDVEDVVNRLPPARPTRRALLFTATLERRLMVVEDGGWLSRLGISVDKHHLEVHATNTVLSASDMASLGRIAGQDGSGDSVGTHSTVASSLRQTYLFIPNVVKLAYLVAALRSAGPDQTTIVFTNSCIRCEIVRLTLQLLGFPVCSLNSIISQKHRIDNLAQFKLGITRILVATDIASRGLDIPSVGLVMHYDIPKQATTYLHRVGRTARAGRDGLSVALVTEHDITLVKQIERKIRCTMKLWNAKGVDETSVLKLLDEVSGAKVQAKLQVEDQFGERAKTLKAHALMKRTRSGKENSTNDENTHERNNKRTKTMGIKQHGKKPSTVASNLYSVKSKTKKATTKTKKENKNLTKKKIHPSQYEAK
uniref:Probable eukaryotic initiation factor 4A n=1 Tax=Trypanosoma congolense (strain IL3000) TaxID=1068625 RepID=G0UXJ2_TRYCI|nr:putative ATP-dependent DEAD/H RNA helicase [Trypanosoma congolense IL3000]